MGPESVPRGRQADGGGAARGGRRIGGSAGQRQYVNAILILLSEPDGTRPLFVDDWQRFRPRDLGEWLVWAGMTLGLGPSIPYQPIGGLGRVRGGFVNTDHVIPLGLGHTLRTDYGAFFHLQNLMLVGQGLGLGGWIHAAVFSPYILQRVPEKHWLGLGFRMEPAREPGRRWPPTPASQPNPVGIDGVLEGLCPPYVKTMDEAVDRVVEEKYGAAGPCYGNPDLFARTYRRREDAEAYLGNATRFTPEAIRYAKEICTYVDETYGRFPAHVDAFYTPGVWLQFSHLEIEYYNRFYAPALYARQAQHAATWAH